MPTAVVALSGLLLCLAVLSGPPGTDRLAVLGGCLVGLTSGAVGLTLLGERRRADPRRRDTVVLFSLALAGYGAGQLVTVADVVDGTRAFPGPGDLITLAVVPLVLVGFAVAPSPSRTALPVLRMCVDGTLLGLAVGLVLWVLVVPDPVRAAEGWPVASLVVVGLGVSTALPLLAAVRDGGRALLLMAASLLAFVGADLVASLHAMGVAVPPAVLAVVTCLQVVLPVAMGLAARAWSRERCAAPDPLARDTDVRTTTTTSVSVAALVGLLLLTGGAQRLDPPGLTMTVCLFALLLVREVLLMQTQRRLVEGLTRQTMTDPLTGLRSALALRQHLSGDVRLVGAVVLDVRGLDSVNQMYGRLAGDELLQRVAAAISEAAVPGSTCYRVGGDEIAVLCGPGVTQDPVGLAERLAAAVCREVRVATSDLSPRMAVGVARARGGSAPAEAVLEDALAAMRLAGQRRSSAPVLHDGAQTAGRQRRLRIEQRLPGALAGGDVTVLAQPVVDLGSRQVVGVEALARWRDPQLGAVSPVEFVEVAEQTGLIEDLGEHVLRTAVAEAVRSGLVQRGVRLSVNVSPLQLSSSRLCDLVGDLVADHGFAPSQLTLEVTESVLLEEDGPALDNLHRLVGLGVAIAIDDFGAGHASLGYVRRVPAHVLKLDRSLVVAAGSDPRARAVVQAGLELCTALGMVSVVEGVETEEVADDLRGLGADLGQGWLWCAAVPFDEVATMLARPVPAPRREQVGREQVGRGPAARSAP